MRPGTLPPQLIAITDSERFPHCLQAAESLCHEAAPGSVALLLREPRAAPSQQLTWGQRLRLVTRSTEQFLVVSERADLAMLLDADGVHLPANGMAPSLVRRAWNGVVSRAGHYPELLHAEDWEALSWLLVSPVFAERKGRAPLTKEGLRRRVREVRERGAGVATFALGGVDSSNAALCLEAGATGVAVIGSAWDTQERAHLLDALGIRRQPVSGGGP